jgi:hypothetical protein
MEVYIAGNTDAIGDMDSIYEKLDAFLSKVRSGEKAILPNIPKNISSPLTPRFDHTYTDIGLSERQQASISLSSNMPRINKIAGVESSKEENRFGAISELAENLLADLVYRKLRLENSWCYGAGASVQPHADYVNFSIGGTINFNHTEEAIEIIWNIIKDIENGSYAADFAKTKRLYIERIIDIVGDSIRLDDSISLLKDMLIEIADISFEEVQKVIKEYFSEDRVFIEVVRPSVD